MVLLLFLSGFYFINFTRLELKKNDYKLWYLSTFCFSLACITNIMQSFLAWYLDFYVGQKLICVDFHRGTFFFHIYIFFTQLPVFVWNLENQFSSFQFHLNTRMDTEFSITSFLKNLSTFILATTLSISHYCYLFI